MGAPGAQGSARGLACRGPEPSKIEEHLKTGVTRLRTVLAELSAEALPLEKRALAVISHRRHPA